MNDDIDFDGDFSNNIYQAPKKIQILEDIDALKRASTKDIVVELVVSHVKAWLFMVFSGVVIILTCIAMYWGKQMGWTISQVHQDWIWIFGSIFGGFAILHFLLDILFGVNIKTFFKYSSIIWILIIFQIFIDFMGLI